MDLKREQRTENRGRAAEAGAGQRRRAPAWPLLALFLSLWACGEAAPEPSNAASKSPVAATDDTGREVRLPHPARRVVSLLPAGTETLFALGAGEQVVGRTRYDTEPHLAHLPSVGGGLDPSLEALIALRPDLVIAFETAGGSKIRARLEQLEIPVFGIQTQDTTDIFRNIQRIGHLLGRDGAADSLTDHIRTRLHAVLRAADMEPRPRVLYVAGIDPPIIAGPGTYVSELIQVAGGEPVHVVEDGAALWPQLSLEALVRADPDVVMLPVGEDLSADVERLRREPGWRDLRAVRQGRIATVPADLTNRPGPRIGEVAERMQAAIRAHRWTR